MDNSVIADYRCLTPMQTAGSGSARWCIAERSFERFFLKQFLSPVYPVRTDTSLGRMQLARCREFEKRKQRLYAAASCVIGDVLVPVIDFFRADGHYYAVSEALPEAYSTGEYATVLSESERMQILYELAVCLQRLHNQGIVHADLKPEHVLLIKTADQWQTKLIDLDSSFLEDEPPSVGKEIEGDPAFLAPETFLRLTGQPVKLSRALDTFSFGLLIHVLWTGRLPSFDRTKYHYIYEAAIDGAQIELELPANWKPVIAEMLSADPTARPGDAEVASLFLPRREKCDKVQNRNGLRKLMKSFI